MLAILTMEEGLNPVSFQSDGETVLLSLRPKFAAQILAGEKRIEFRRVWPGNPVRAAVLYATSPIQRLVGLAYVERVVKLTTTELWNLAQELGGGVSFRELDQYLKGKDMSYGIILASARKAQSNVDPKDLYPNFRPPQSYRYLSKDDFAMAVAGLFP